MSSSWLLSKRKAMTFPDGRKVWDMKNFSDTNDGLGGLSDMYIVDGATGECHPDYQAIPMGDPYGFMVCKKRKRPLNRPDGGVGEATSGLGIGVSVPRNDAASINGYHKFSADLYDPKREVPIQLQDPYYYYDRTVPNEMYFHRNDYLARQVQYSGDGIRALHTPGPRKYFEYGFSYTPLPPPKYDIQRLQQPYELWRDIQEYHGVSREELDRFDREYNESIPASTW